jgi:hypothetical protein
VAVTCDGDRAVVYVDGQAVRMQNRLRRDASIAGGDGDDDPITIGGRMVTAGGNMRDPDQPFLGTIDDLRLYDRALRADEIRALANQ